MYTECYQAFWLIHLLSMVYMYMVRVHVHACLLYQIQPLNYEDQLSNVIEPHKTYLYLCIYAEVPEYMY